MIEPSGDNSTDFLAFKQRKREVQLAVNLVAKMNSFMEGEVAVFTERCQTEAEELSGKLRPLELLYCFSVPPCIQ